MLTTVLATLLWMTGLAELVAAASLFRRTRRPGIRPLAVLLAALSVYTVAYGFEILRPSIPWMLGWLRVEYLGVPFIGWAWWWLAWEVSSGRSGAPRWRGWLAVVPACTAAVALLGGGSQWIHAPPHEVRLSPIPIFQFEPGPLYRAIWAYNWTLAALGTSRLLTRAAIYGGVYRRQLRVWLAAFAVPALANLAYAAGLQPSGAFDINPFAFAIGGAIVAPVVLRRSLLDVIPIARARALDALSEGVIVMDADGVVLDVNPAAARMIGAARIGRSCELAFEMSAEFGRAISAAEGSGPKILHDAGPSRRVIEWRQQPIGDPASPEGRVVWLRDITEEYRMQAELRARDRLLAALARSARLLLGPAGLPELRGYIHELGQSSGVERLHLILGTLPDGTTLSAPVEVARWDAAEPTAVSPTPPRCPAENAADVLREWVADLRGAQSVAGMRETFAPPARALLETLGLSAAVAAPILWGRDAGGLLMLGLTREHRAPTAAEIEFVHGAALHLALALRRDRMEAAAHEARQTESVGRLAAGLARDFNNLNQVVLGYTETLRDAFCEGDSRRADLAEIEGAARRAVQITRQLLAVGESLNLSMVPMEVHALLRHLAPMIERMLGPSIVMELRLDAPDDHVIADASLIEYAFLGLVANARDAMPLGGQLLIRTRNIEIATGDTAIGELAAGRYLGVDVSDNGIGMNETTRSHLFEPFFSRNPGGRSIGLNLAAIRGTLKQHGGDVRVESVEGRGSTFTVLLPVRAPPSPSAAAPATAQAV
ncbi:MAG: ATP-binding protein [Kiritimatiellae bacterium]|nr:ATP-binding protein [Kiritimatiellia bacterium]